jgi:hypothetical protein
MVNESEMMASGLRIGVVLSSMLSVLAACSPATARGASGTYVAADETGAIMIQIVESADHSLSGTYQALFLKDGGRLEGTNMSVTGAVDGAQITLAVQAIEFLPISVSYSGVIRGSNMDLTYVDDGEVSRFTLVRATVDDFVQWSNRLRSESERLQAEQAQRNEEERVRRAEQDRLRSLSALVEELERVTAASPDLRARVAQTGERHRAATASVSELAASYSHLGRRTDDDAVVERWDLEAEIYDAGEASLTIRDDIQRLAEDFGFRHERRLAAIADHRAACEIRDDADCARFATSADAYLIHADALLAALAQAETDYLTERQKRRDIVAQLE